MSELRSPDSTNPLSDSSEMAAHRPMAFRFISGLDNTYSRPIRAHVLQRHMRERRLRAEIKRENKNADSNSDLALARRRTQHSKRPNAVRAPAAPGRSRTVTSQIVTPTSSKSLARYVGPQSLLGQGTGDPFLSTASGRMTTTEHLLVDYYCGDILAPHGITKDIHTLHPPRDMCIKMNLSDPATMFATFTYTAEAIYVRGGSTKYAMIAAQYRVATIRVIKERVEREKCLSETTLLAVIGLVASVCDQRMHPTTQEREREMQLHVQGLRAMIAARGGISPRLYSPTVYWLLYWIDLCETGNAFPPSRLSTERDFASSKLKSFVSQDESWFAVDPSNDRIQDNAEELARVYSNIYYTAKARSVTSRRTAPEIVSSQSRAWLLHPVQRDTNLYRTLASPPAGILRSIAPALYLNIILWHYRRYYDASSSNTDEIDVFRCIIHKARPAKSTVALIWALVTDPDSYRLHHPQSAWLLTRLLRVECRLSIHLQRWLKTTLVQFLLTDEVEHLKILWLTPEQFRTAIMTDLNLESGESRT